MTEKQSAPPYPTNIAQKLPALDESGDLGFYSYLHILLKRKKVIFVSVLIALSMALFVNMTQKPIYESSTEVVLQSKESDSSATGPSVTPILQDPTFLLTQIRVIRSPLLAEKILGKFEKSEIKRLLRDCFAIKPSDSQRSKEGVPSEGQIHALISAIQNSVSAAQVERGARIIAISVRGYDAAMVKQLADTAAESYIEINYESQIGSFKKSFSVISKSLSEIREKIKIGELALQKITKELELLGALKVYGEKHPLVIELSATIEILSKEISRNVSSLDLSSMGPRKNRFSILAIPHLDLSSLSLVEIDLQNLKPLLEQEVRTNRQLYDALFKRLQEVELSGARSIWSDAKVIEPANMPASPISPNKKRNFILAFVVGFLIGLGLAYFLEYLDSSLQTLDDLRSYLKIFPLGVVPLVELDLPDLQEVHDPLELPTGTRPFWNTCEKSLPLYVSEAYRIIRTSLAFGSVDRSLKVIQVTSAVKGEGKTTTACNLGISLAQTGIKTLLIDADMRRPSLHHILKLGDNLRGLSTALSSDDLSNPFIQETQVPNLYCMTGGVIPPNPAELLSSKRLKKLLEHLKNDFDMIILDSPPVVSVADSPIIASFAEGTILVSRAGYIPRHISLRAKNSIEAVNGKIIGGILNCVSAHHHSYYGYYGSRYGYNDYYGESDTAQRKGKKSKKRPRSKFRKMSVVDKLKALKEPIGATVASGWGELNNFMKSLRPPDDNEIRR